MESSQSINQSKEKLENSEKIIGDFDNEIIALNKGKLCLEIRVKNDEHVSFHLSQNGKLQISSSDAELLRRARSQLREFIVCTKWIPSSPEKKPSKSRKKEPKITLYESIMDLPEAKKADWSRVSDDDFEALNQAFATYKMASKYGLDLSFTLDFMRSTLARYVPSKSDDGYRIEKKSFIDKVKSRLIGKRD